MGTEFQGKKYATKMVNICAVRIPGVANRSTSVIAAQTIANIVKSSLGPLGLDKMLVDNIGVSLGHVHLIDISYLFEHRKSPYRTTVPPF